MDLIAAGKQVSLLTHMEYISLSDQGWMIVEHYKLLPSVNASIHTHTHTRARACLLYTSRCV